MTRIGASWVKHDKNNKFYQSIAIDEAILPLTITKDKRLVLKPNENKGNNENAPDNYLEIFIPDKTKKAKDETIIDELECPF